MSKWVDSMFYTIGTDVGTTGTKSVVLSQDGKILSTAYRAYPISARPGGIAEQNATDWWDAVVQTVRECVSNVSGECLAISLSTQGSTMFCADENREPMHPAITWMDMRSEAECKILDGHLGKNGIYRITGWKTDSGCDAAKLLWLSKNEPELFTKASKYLSTVEYINFKLTGRDVIDPTNASIREIYSISDKTWSDDILSLINVPKNKLPDLAESGEYIGNLTQSAADTLGLSTTVKVYCGAHDQYCASIGCGAVNVGDMMLSTGTAWVLLGITDKLSFTDSYITPGIHPIPGKFGALASLGGVGNAIKWIKDTFCIDDYMLFDKEAEKRMESAKDVIFMPFFSGAGFPTRDSSMSATVSGLRLGNDRYDIARAVMEGVGFEVRSSLEKYADEGIDISKLKIMGGASRSDVWCNIVAYATGCEITRMENSEACAMGAAMIAAVGCGMIKDYSHTASGKALIPNDKAVLEHYEEKYKKYISLKEAVRNG